MGKGQQDKWWPAERRDQGYKGHGGRRPSWQYWQGSWPVQGRPQPKAQATRYSEIDVDADRTRPEASDSLSDIGSAAMPQRAERMNALQKVLTQARKADGRARRIREEQSRREKQWEAWKAKAQKEFVKQKKLFEADTAKAQADLAAALQAGEEAAANVQLIVDGQGLPPAAPETEDADWTELITEANRAPVGEHFLQTALAAVSQAGLLPDAPSGGPPPRQIRPELMQQFVAMVGALGRALNTAAAGHPGQGTVPATYTSTPPPGLNKTETFLAASPGPALTGPPPPTSEGLTGADKKEKLDVRTSPHHPGQRDASQPRLPTSEAPPRKAIKAASMAATAPHNEPRGPGLAAKLETVRENMRATMPFGGTGSHPMARLLSGQAISLEDDDMEEDDLKELEEEAERLEVLLDLFGKRLGGLAVTATDALFFHWDDSRQACSVPCDIEDAVALIERSPLVPDWVSYSALTEICLDLRDMLPGGTGPVIATFVTRPTSRAEICREAGSFGVDDAKVFVGTDAIPLADDESVVLSSGCLVTLMRTDRCPYVANDLQYRLQFPAIWALPARFPSQTKVRASLLFLHKTGRFVVGSRPRDRPADVAAAQFIGIARESVDIYAPRSTVLEHFQYRGTEVRGVLAMVERSETPQHVIFLDLRLVAEGIKFVVLPRPYIMLTELDDDEEGEEEDGFSDDSEVQGLASSLHVAVSRVTGCKLLVEPTDGTPTSQLVIETLRWLAGEMGEGWPYLPVDDWSIYLPTDTDTSEGDTSAARQLTINVLVPEYAPEQLVIDVQLPAVFADIVPLIAAARDPAQVDRFPSIQAVLPQYITGTGVFTATPHWNPQAVIVCLDIRAIDGRMYAAHAPAYADRSLLCELADLPAAADIQVYVGVDAHPLEGEALAHLIPGIAIAFVARHERPRIPWDFLGALITGTDFCDSHPWKPPEEAHVYCLVHGNRHRRFQLNLGEPFRHRQQLASAIGASGQPVLVVPAEPKVTDIELDGVPCATAVAVIARDADGDRRPQCLLVDCRPLLEGWMCWTVSNFEFAPAPLLADFRITVPLGYDAGLENFTDEDLPVPVTPGQVIIAKYVQRPALLADLPEGDSPTADPAVALPLQTPTIEGAMDAIDQNLPALLTAADEPASVDTFTVQVLIAVPEYLPELYEVEISPPVRLTSFIAHVEAQRGPVDSRRFPCLTPVFPQPDRGFATFVATPRWPMTQCTVLVDARTLDGRIFALMVPHMVDHALLVTLADVPATQEVHIFASDVPWPLATGRYVPAAEGDLFVIVPPEDVAIPRTALSDMLRGISGWDAFAGDFGDRVWLVTDTEPLQYEVNRSRRLDFREDVARAIGARVDSVVLQPVRPQIRDFADHGRLVRSVLLALTLPFPIEDTGAANASTALQVTFAQFSACAKGAFTYSVVAGPPAATVAFDTGSGCLQPSLDDAELQPLTTLLSESAAQSQEWAFLAVTLIEVLTEHFSVGAHTKPSKLEPVTIDLESAIPVTSYQQQCLDLARIIPPSRPLTEDAPDWLDNDFAPLLRFRGATQAQRTAFANIVCWHNAVAWEAVTDVDVFTDGSASSAGSVTDVAPAGWAFTVWLRTPARSLFYGAAYGTAVPPFTAYYVGETQDSALQAELLGLSMFTMIARQQDKVPFARPSQPGKGLSWFAVILRQCAQHRVPLGADYVPGHAGHIGNELSDCFAKYARANIMPLDQRPHPLWPSLLYRRPLAEFAWMLVDLPGDVPPPFAFEAAAACLRKHPAISRQAPSMGLIAPQVSEQAVRFELMAVTCNILTLLDKPLRPDTAKVISAGMKVKGRRHLLTEQCVEAGVHFLGLQETRLQETATLPDSSYIMMHSSATSQGHLGCALWVSKVRPYYANHKGQPLCFESKHCTVAAFSSRHLLASISAPFFRCKILVAHSPSCPRDDATEAVQFWQHRSQEIARLPADWPLLVLTDANSRLGQLLSPSVGPVAAVAETAAGAAFHEFLLRHNLFLPATMPDVHRGDTWTWCSAAGERHRIDYVAFPQAWAAFEVESFGWYEIELLQKRQDHVPACATCRFQNRQSAGQEAQTAFKRKACRPNDLDPQLNTESFCQKLHQGPLPAWELDVDKHFEQFVHAWTEAGNTLIQPCAKPPRQSFLTQATMDLVWARKGLRRYLKCEEAELSRRRLMVCFAAFLLHAQGAEFSDIASARAVSWLRDLHISIARAWSLHGQACHALRQAVRQDRNSYLDSLVKNVSLADIRQPKQFFQQVRKAFPKAASAKRTRFMALPAVELADGSTATTTEERIQRWREHFSEQESGTPVDEQGYRGLLAKKDARSPTGHTKLDVQLLPSLRSLEGTILDLKRAKAAGPDGLTAELLKVMPAEAARQLCQSSQRSVLTYTEARVLRIGRLPGLVFYDVRAAYYQVLRECLTGEDLDDRVLLRLFNKLGVPSSAFVELKEQLSRLAVLAASGCTPHTVALLREVFTGTWFRMDQHTPLVATAAGVRPGDPLADIMFAISFSAYARSVQDALAAANLATFLPASKCQAPWDDNGPIQLGPASWADDFAALHEAADATSLIQVVCATTEVYLSHATANGIQLAFATDKTAAVLPPKASFNALIRHCPQEGAPYLPIRDAITGRTQHLPVVQAYKHLGGIVTSASTVVPEIHFRHSQATWPFGRSVLPSLATPAYPSPLGDTCCFHLSRPSLHLAVLPWNTMLRGIFASGHACIQRSFEHYCPEQPSRANCTRSPFYTGPTSAHRPSLWQKPEAVFCSASLNRAQRLCVIFCGSSGKLILLVRG
ncbi:hypothetical protein AK812_SmicGene6444 [Symbiodinium microadriaticum]|uniref:RNase H type-1 domain-containing protein n=1 Tax=Symbiodinium microadriaticum TaxID=2951 RepID=A0A1Q9ER23_SYMMI|nr:hypothetical protein AK812_SmicGene6444 [Symbiodinium microadriaticum]